MLKKIFVILKKAKQDLDIKLNKLTIKKVIFLLNTFMVLISLVVMLFIGEELILLFKGRFLKQISEKSMVSDNTFYVKEMLTSLDEYGDEWNQLDNTLKKYDFRLLVKDEKNKNVYSSIKNSEMEGVEGLFSIPAALDEIHVYYLNKITVVQTKVKDDGKEYMIYAANCPSEQPFLGSDRGIFEVFLIVFMIVGSLSIIAILIISQIITSIVVKRVLKPVDELSSAARRIADGNYNEAINYKKENEFKNVFDSFDAMQVYLRDSIEKNAAYEKARTEMISGISHDLRTPLTSIKGFVKGMIDGVASTEEKRQKYLEIVYKKSCQMDELLKKLFYFSKLETGRMPFFKKKVNLEEYIETFIRSKKEELDDKSISIEFKSSLKEYKYALIDTDQMDRVFNNIIENSIKYSNADVLKICIYLKNTDGNKIKIIISDNGQGMDEEKIAHIFEQFYRGDESRNSKIDGNGLGMYVCKYIVKEHWGIIKAFKNNGLTIVIELSGEKRGEE